MLTNFLEWIGLKEKLHERAEKYLFTKEGEIWWCAIGENVGIEINGKGNMFSRPVLVYKKLGKLGFLAIPLSSKSKQGPWFAGIKFKNKNISANLAQVRVISTARLYSKMGEITADDFAKVKGGFLRLYS